MFLCEEMANIFYSPKIDDIDTLKCKIRDLLETDHDHCSVVVPYGIQQQYMLKVPKPVRFCLSFISSGAHTIAMHYGAGVCNKISVWTQDSHHHKARRVLSDMTIELRVLRLLYMPNNFQYVAACADMTIRTYDNEFTLNAIKELSYTVLDMIYCDFLDVIITSGIGFIHAIRLSQCLHDAPIVIREIQLPMIDNTRTWINQLSIDTKNKEILAVSHEGVFFIAGNTVEELSYKKLMKNRHAQSISSAVVYPRRHYIITGSKDGTIIAWNTTMQRFPFFGNFQGHMKTILQLAIHNSKPLLFSSSTDDTIRIWSIETFSETYRFNVQEPVISFDLMGPNSIIYTTQRETRVCELNLIHSLFSSIGAEARRLLRVSGKDLPSRIMYQGRDGGVRLVSPVHGSIISMTFPVIGHHLIDVLHDARNNSSYAVLEDGDVMVFSTETNPCSTIQLWKAKNTDEKICSLETLESAILSCDGPAPCTATLLFGGHVSGHISLLKGKNFHLEPLKAHQGCVVMLRARRYSNSAETTATAQMASYATDNIIIVWRIVTQMRIIDTEEKYELKFDIIMQIDMIDRPFEMVFVGKTFTIATPEHLIFHRLKSSVRNGRSTVVNQVDFINDSMKQDHSGSITQICCCESLEVIAASGKDRHVRIWGADNHLIRELCFDHDIEGICFGNDRADLIIALQGNLYHIESWHCLNRFYMKKLLDMELVDDIIEKPNAFDPLLKFWYDDFWVQKVPISRTNNVKIRGSRKKSIGLMKKDYARLRALLLFGSSFQDEDPEVLAGVFNSRLVGRRSYVFELAPNNVPVRKHTTCRQTLSSPINLLKANEKTATDCLEDEQRSSGLVTVKNRTVQDECIFEEDPLYPMNEDSDTGVRLPANKENTAGDSTEDQGKTEHEENSFIENTNCLPKFWPCAPDGYLPNSVIRGIIRPTPPDDYSAIIKELDQKEANAKLQRVTFDLAKLQKLLTIEEEQRTKADSPEQPSETSFNELRRRLLFGDDDSDEDSDEVSSSQSECWHSESPKTSEDEDNDVNETLDDVHGDSLARNNAVKPILKKEENKITKKTLKSKTKGPKSSKKPNKKREKHVTMQVEPEFTTKEKDDEELLEPAQVTSESNQDAIHEIFKSRLGKDWFPKSTGMDPALIIRETLKKLNDKDVMMTRDICNLIVDIKEHLNMTTPVLNEALEALRNIMTCKSPSIKLAAMKKSFSELRRRLLLGDDDSDEDSDKVSAPQSKCWHSESPKISEDEDNDVNETLDNVHGDILARNNAVKPILKKEKNKITKKTLKNKTNGPKSSKKPNKKREKHVTMQVEPEFTTKEKDDEELLEPAQVTSESNQDAIHEIFKSRLGKDWFPKSTGMDPALIVRETLKKLNDKDVMMTRDICNLIVDIKEHLKMMTPVLNEALEALRNIMTCKSPAIKLAAVKTSIQLAKLADEACDLVLPDLIKMLNDPAKVVREETKQGLFLLAGIEDFSTLEKVARRLSILKEGALMKKDAETFEDLKRRKFDLLDNAVKAQLLNHVVNDWMAASQPLPPIEDENQGQNYNGKGERKGSRQGDLVQHEDSSKEVNTSALDLVQNYSRKNTFESIVENGLPRQIVRQENNDCALDMVQDYSRKNTLESIVENGLPRQIVRQENNDCALDMVQGYSRKNTLESIVENGLPRQIVRQENNDCALDMVQGYSRENTLESIVENGLPRQIVRQENNDCALDMVQDYSRKNTLESIVENGLPRQIVRQENNDCSTTEIDPTSYIKTIAPRLAKKFEQLKDSTISEHSSVVDEEMKDNDDVNALLFEQESESSKQTTYPLDHNAAGGKTVTIAEDEPQTERHSQSLEFSKRSVKKKLSKNCRSVKGKENLVHLLFEVSAYTLLLKRNFRGQILSTNDDEISRNLTKILSFLNNEDSKLLHEPSHVLKYLERLKDDMQKEAAKYMDIRDARNSMTGRIQSEDTKKVARNKEIDPTVHHQDLIRSPISRGLVPGIRGERIAQKLELARGVTSRSNLKREHNVLGIPERLGNMAAADSGFCRFGKMKMSWTSRAPFYDMDLTTLNEQRIRPLRIPRRALSDIKERNKDRPGNESILPLLFKQRLSTARQQTRPSVGRKDLRRHMVKRSIIRLPRLAVDSEDRPRPDSSGSLISDLNMSKSASNPPPPPNTAELRP